MPLNVELRGDAFWSSPGSGSWPCDDFLITNGAAKIGAQVDMLLLEPGAGGAS